MHYLRVNNITIAAVNKHRHTFKYKLRTVTIAMLPIVQYDNTRPISSGVGCTATCVHGATQSLAGLPLVPR